MSLAQAVDGETRKCLTPGYIKLQQLMDERKAATESGEWPACLDETPPDEENKR
jgi:hypothetical protein